MCMRENPSAESIGFTPMRQRCHIYNTILYYRFDILKQNNHLIYNYRKIIKDNRCFNFITEKSRRAVVSKA